MKTIQKMLKGGNKMNLVLPFIIIMVATAIVVSQTVHVKQTKIKKI